jgi:hypothetical protein
VQRYTIFLNYVHFLREKFANTPKKTYLCRH